MNTAPGSLEERLRLAFPEASWWEVRGERILRGRLLERDAWVYVLVGDCSYSAVEVTAEFVEDTGEMPVLAQLAGRGRS